ncbi:MAG: tetratricopeptide repeat protein [Methanobacteriota archaeon]
MGERVLVHLSSFARYADAYEYPGDVTQDGIAEALGISRAHAALELKRLKDAGRIEERVAHVAKARTRRKVYVLAPAGLEIARRMREHAKARRVVVIEGAGTRDASGAEAIEALRRAGVRESEAVERVLTLDVIEIPRAAAVPPPAAPEPDFFGREDELRTLRAWLASDESPVAVVVGVAGIGKTALVSKALESETRPTVRRRVHAHDDAHGLLASFAEALARHGRRRLKAIVSRAGYDPVDALAVLRQDLAGSVVAIDDLHASPAADGLLTSLLEAPPRAKVLVASRTRPAFCDRATAVGLRIAELDLGGLSEAAARDLLATRRASLPEDDVVRIVRATRGHPLALVLFAASGLDAGRAETERYVLETILEGLDDGSERALTILTVLRQPIPDPEAVGAGLAAVRRLVRTALLQVRPEGLAVHDLVREFLLGRMEPAGRRTADERAAAYWESRGDLLEAVHHHLEAGHVDRAASLLASGGHAVAEGPRAGELEALLLRLPAERRPRLLLADARVFLGRFAEARDVLESIVSDGPPDERLRARVLLGRVAHRLGEYERARSILRDAVRDAVDDRRLRAEALRALGGVERRLGDLPAALEHLRQAVALLDDDPREKARALTDLGAARLARGDVAGAKASFLEAAPFAPAGSREEAAVRNNLAIVLHREGRTSEAADAFASSADIAARAGEMRFASLALANAVENLLALDDTVAAEATAERALRLADSVADPIARSTARANLGLVLARRGDWSKAEEHLLGSVALIENLGNPHSLATRCEEVARMYEAQGRVADAVPWRARAEDLFGRLRDGGTGSPPRP